MEQLTKLATLLGERIAQRGQMIVTAESCTGGWIAKVLTDVPGSSAWFERGFVTYHNRAKVEMLGVSTETLNRHGAVSEPVVREMAEGALRRSAAERAVAVSGIAGPGGATPGKPVGTVWLAWAVAGQSTRARCFHFDGDREGVRRQAVVAALDGLLQDLG
jgi:nicotinamide-nucleotide amidase